MRWKLSIQKHRVPAEVTTDWKKINQKWKCGLSNILYVQDTWYHPAAWKSPKSSSTVSCSIFSAAAGSSGAGSPLEGRVLVLLMGSAAGCSWGGNSALKGEAATPESVGETGEGGGGGSLRETGASLVFVFSFTESLFRPCSKNADFVLVPVSFCTE